jgi:hypothetical protein
MVSGVASAQAQPQQFSYDVVVLKDGTVLRGSVGEMVPNLSITITVDGQPRKVDWKDVDRVDIDRAKAGPPLPPPPPPAPPALPVRPMTLVHVYGPPNATIQALQNGTMTWTDVCKGTCDQELPTDGLYRIDAPGIRASRAFKIAGSRSNLEVDAASSTGFAGGLTLLIIGGAALVNGIGFFVDGLLTQEIDMQTSKDFTTAGLVLGGIGLVSMITGGFLLGSNRRTTVNGATTVRVPAWRDFPQPSATRAVAAVSFPAISGTF